MKKSSDIPSLGYLVTKIGRMVAKEYASELEPLGITPLQAGILMNLAIRGHLSQAQLMSALTVDKASMNQMLKALKSKGMIVMARSSEDRRHWQISLESKARPLLPKISRIDDAISKKYERLLGKEPLVLKKLLWQLYQNIQLANENRS
jgi:DNA-binding MarR family transcriptional regulator